MSGILTGDWAARLWITLQQMPDRSYRVYMGLEVLSIFTRPGGDADITDPEKARDAVLQHYAE